MKSTILVTGLCCALAVGCSASSDVGDGGAAGAGSTLTTGGAGGTSAAGGTGATAGSGGSGAAAGGQVGGGGHGGNGASGGGVGGTGVGGGTGGSPPVAYAVGCADASREGFADQGSYPLIAACGGAWDVPGIFDMQAQCGRAAGNDGTNPSGTGCTVTDLCADGWRVCYGRDDVLARNPGGCAGVLDGAVSPVFFTTQMSSTGAFQCSTAADATNDLFGCGDLGCDFTSNATVQQMCAPLVMSSHDLCKGLRNDLSCGDWCNHLGKYPSLNNAWSCGSNAVQEALNVTKSLSDQQGGVLCCRIND